MAANSLKYLREIYKSLKDDKEGTPKKVYVVGKKGVGKTWVVKKATDLAIKKEIYDFALWVFLCREYDSKALSESIARQLSLLPCSEEREVEDDNNGAKEKEKEKEESEDIADKIRRTLLDKKVLLVLDDEGSKMTEAEIMTRIENLLPNPSKVLIIKAHHTDDEISDVFSIEVEPLSPEDSSKLLKERMDSAVIPGFNDLAEAFIEKCGNLYGEIITLAKALSFFGKDESGMKIVENALVEAKETQDYKIRRLLFSGNEKGNPLPLNILIDCSWSGRPHFFRDCGSVHYNELITYWILEGYFSQVDSIEKAYEEGHRVLMELIDYQILKMMESGFVNIPELNSDHFCHRRGFGGIARLGLANVFDTEWEGFGRITQKDGVIKSLCKDSNPSNLSTLLLEGSQHRLLDDLDALTLLKFLALFNPTYIRLPYSLSKITNLTVLVLRGCDFLEEINVRLDLKHLTAIEISRAHSLRRITSEFFTSMTKLRSVNLSKLKIKSLPNSLFRLNELRWLLVRDCSHFDKLDSINKLADLIVLDLSGSTSLKSFFDKTFSKNPKLQSINLSGIKVKAIPVLANLNELTHLSVSQCTNLDRLRSVTSLTKLRVLDISGSTKFKEFHNPSLENLSSINILDFSGTLLDYLPCNLANPEFLYLKRCLLLKHLPRIDGLKDLKLLDLSGSTELDEIAEDFFNDLTCLKELNLSETKLRKLPPISNLCNLRKLLLSGCGLLRKLPELSSLGKLEVLDASECCNLTEIQDKSFEHMSRLQVLNLSAAKIEVLPPLSNPSNLRHLILKKCTALEELPPLKSLVKLEELNLSGVGLKEGADFVKDMSSLKILDLSKTNIEKLPSLANLKNLLNLSIGGCKSLQTVPNVDELTKLEVIDLSDTAVTHLPSLKSFSNLRELRLRGCSGLEEFQRLNLNDVLKGTVAEVPDAISEFTHLEILDPPSTKSNEEADRESKILEEELNQHPWIISNWQADEIVHLEKLGISVSGTQFLKFLEENPMPISFKKFHFLVHPIEAHKINSYMHSYSDELVVRDIYFTRLAHMERERSLEIRGFSSFPNGVEDVLRHAEFVFLIDSPFIVSLSDLGSANIKGLKSCWVERCTKMDSIVHVEETAEFADCLEVMWVSHAINLKNIYSGNLQVDVFKNLKLFYLDCCGQISNLFTSTHGLESLEVLQIKFCDKLENVFQDESPKILPRLKILHLWGLPSLKRVGCVAPALQSLKVCECPKLVNVLSPAQLPANLEILHVKLCDQLKTLIENSDETVIENSESTTTSVLQKLKTIHMWELPQLKSIGAELVLPQDCNILNCPKFESVPGSTAEV